MHALRNATTALFTLVFAGWAQTAIKVGNESLEFPDAWTDFAFPIPGIEGTTLLYMAGFNIGGYAVLDTTSQTRSYDPDAAAAAMMAALGSGSIRKTGDSTIAVGGYSVRWTEYHYDSVNVDSLGFPIDSSGIVRLYFANRDSIGIVASALPATASEGPAMFVDVEKALRQWAAGYLAIRGKPAAGGGLKFRPTDVLVDVLGRRRPIPAALANPAAKASPLFRVP